MEIDKDAIRQWIDATEDWPASLDVVFRFDSPTPGDLAAVIDAIPDIDDWRWDELQLIAEPEESPLGPLVSIEYEGYFPQVEEFLDTLGGRLDAAGRRGRVVIARTQEPPFDYTLVKRSSFVAGLCGEIDDGGLPPRALRDHAIRWCSVQGGSYYVRFGVAQYLVSPESRDVLLDKALRGSGIIGLTCFAAPDRVRRVAFLDQGTVLYEEMYPGIDDPGGWREGLADMTRVLGELAPVLEYGLVRRCHYGAFMWEHVVDLDWPAKPHLQRGAGRRARHRSGVTVPDAFGVMVLSPTHSWDAPGGWTTSPLSGERRLVSYDDAESVFGEPRPNEGTVERMRSDMFSLLMVDEDQRPGADSH